MHEDPNRFQLESMWRELDGEKQSLNFKEAVKEEKKQLAKDKSYMFEKLT